MMPLNHCPSERQGAGMQIRLFVRGDRACFKRPEFAEDLISYDVMTPLAARCILEAIHVAPGTGWQIDEIRVLRPIRSTWMSLAEIEFGKQIDGIVGGRRDRRMAQVLTDVAYVVAAHAGVARRTAHDDDHLHTFRDRAAAGRFVRPPCLGHRTFPAELSLIEQGDALPATALADSGTRDLGWMLHDYERDGRGPCFFRAMMIDGVIDLRQRDSVILAR